MIGGGVSYTIGMALFMGKNENDIIGHLFVLVAALFVTL